jgi:hypothetical protein
MLVFDPLAVSLVVGANVIFGDKNKEKEKLEKIKLIDSKIQKFEEREKEFNQLNQEFESKLKEIEEYLEWIKQNVDPEICEIMGELGLVKKVRKNTTKKFIIPPSPNKAVNAMDMNESFQFDKEYRKILSNFK